MLLLSIELLTKVRRYGGILSAIGDLRIPNESSIYLSRSMSIWWRFKMVVVISAEDMNRKWLEL